MPGPEAVEIGRCAVCHGAERAPLYEGIARCVDCGHVFSESVPSDGEIARLYGREYFHGAEYGDYLADERVAERNFRLRLDVLERFLDPARHRHLFEVGCAHGFFLRMASGRFESARGIEISDHAAVYAREDLGLDVVRGDIRDCDLGEGIIDVACLWDTIEHLREPDRTVRRIGESMRTGGLVALTTGDIGSLVARVRKRRWRLLHPPTHLHYFSRETIRRMLAESRFEIVYDRPCGFYRSVSTAAYRLFVLKRDWSTLHRWLLRTGLGRLTFYANLHDIRYVIARKG